MITRVVARRGCPSASASGVVERVSVRTRALSSPPPLLKGELHSTSSEFPHVVPCLLLLPLSALFNDPRRELVCPDNSRPNAFSLARDRGNGDRGTTH